MPKKYVNMRSSHLQDNADNWLLMIPADKLCSDSKIVYLALKKMQWSDLSCQTDAHSWFKITGLNFDRVKECLIELEKFGLVETYLSPKNFKNHNRNFSVYLLDHFAMKKMYPLVDCPHDGMSVQNPLEDFHILKNHTKAKKIKEFKDSI